jgi:hypothetical protein
MFGGKQEDAELALGGVGRRFGLPAHLTTAFWTILCGAFLSYRSMQSSIESMT